MSVPANLMQQMLKQQGGARPGAPAGAPPPGMQGPASDASRTMPPAAAPFATPQEKRGNKATAMANVHIALTLLEQAIPDLGSDSPEGLSVIKAVQGLAKLAGDHDNSDLVPAEIMHMVKQMPQMGGGTPMQQELMRQMAQQNAPKPPQGVPGGAPGGAPPPPGAM
ncbi:MAG: hypothetical protein HRJ53_09465 [Acidobacteria bacterium Pan2503]|uniref:Uncharacterized protein n=1 Tax=Candidatus Acidiferrum panamense TaxID=2741543 RepID=A0A7V8SWR8_9BACT|nr:hypothetical protein [Candidatus Acidoferrum panamensis]